MSVRGNRACVRDGFSPPQAGDWTFDKVWITEETFDRSVWLGAERDGVSQMLIGVITQTTAEAPVLSQVARDDFENVNGDANLLV